MSTSVVIIGAGFGGLGMAMELQRHGFDDFTILERADDLGGVWRENTYPGAGCDIPSPLYSWSFEPRSDWPKRFSLQADILAYIQDVADRHHLRDKIRFGSEVADAEYDDSTRKWRVRTTDGAELTADVLITAVGQLSRPALPNIPGVDTFAGTAFHSAEWNHDVDLTGKRVAVIGTGASAIQFVPEIQQRVDHLTVFQRSAAWVIPRPDTAYKPVHHAVFKYVPPVRLAERGLWYALGEFSSLGFVDIPAIRPLLATMCSRHLRKQVPDEALRAKLTPDYPGGCKRALFSDDYFPALTQPNVAVETGAIETITPTGVRTADGVDHDVDVIIYGTGFKGTEFLWPINIFGAEGRKLGDSWTEGGHAYLGMTVPGFPNMFMMYGPNTNLGSNSIIFMLESQARYIRQLIAVIDEGKSVSVKADVEESFNEQLQGRLDRSVWTLCSSWYRNASGRITNDWPGTTFSYRLRTRKPNLNDFEVISEVAAK